MSFTEHTSMHQLQNITSSSPLRLVYLAPDGDMTNERVDKQHFKNIT